MSATATAVICEEQVQVRRERRPCARPSGVTLGQLLTRTHNSALSGVEADCPVCGGEMSQHGLEARCADCGSRLS